MSPSALPWVTLQALGQQNCRSNSKPCNKCIVYICICPCVCWFPYENYELHFILYNAFIPISMWTGQDVWKTVYACVYMYVLISHVLFHWRLIQGNWYKKLFQSYHNHKVSYRGMDPISLAATLLTFRPSRYHMEAKIRMYRTVQDRTWVVW